MPFALAGRMESTTNAIAVPWRAARHGRLGQRRSVRPRQSRPREQLDLGLARASETTVIGVEVPVNAQSIQVRAIWSPFQSLSCTAAPAVFRSAIEGRDIDVLRLGFTARYQMTPTMAAEASYGDEKQRGTVGSAGVQTLRHRTLSIGLTQQWK